MSVFFNCWTTSRWRIFIGSSFRVLIPDRIAHGCFECAFRSSDLRSRRSITMCLWSVKIPAVLSFLQVNLLFFVNVSISFCCFRIFSSKSRSYGSEICYCRACSSIEFSRSLFVSLTFVASLDCLLGLSLLSFLIGYFLMRFSCCFVSVYIDVMQILVF